MPFFSIILPTYNRASFLQRSISSVLNQTFTDFELIIIDDASTDNTKDVIDTFNDERIRYFKNEKNRERSASRNKGIELSKGKYICFLDSDDSYKVHHLKTLNDFIVTQNEPVAFIFTNSIRYNNGIEQKLNSFPQADEYPVEWVLRCQQPPILTIAVHKTIVLKHRFNEKFTINEDIHLWARIVSLYPWYHIDKFTTEIFIHEDCSSLSKKDNFKKQVQVLKDICKQEYIKGKISKKFIRIRMQWLRAMRINTCLENKQYSKSNTLIFLYILRYPFAYQNKYRLYLLLSSIPVFRIIVKSFSTLKSKISKS